MTACMQPACIGTIVDGYCDVCGSPAGAPPFVPVGAAVQQPNLAEEERPTRRIPRVQLTTQPPSTQETAAPAAADPDERPTRRIPRVQLTTQPPSNQETAAPTAADPDEKPTQLIPRVQLTTQPPSTQETAAPAAADPGAVGTEKVDEEKVDPAAAHQGLSTASGLSQQADTQNASTTAAKPADTQQTDTQQTDIHNADPTTAKPVDTQQADTEDADPTAADTEVAATAHTGPDDADTVEIPLVGAVLSRSGHPRPQLPEQEVHGPPPVQKPANKKRFGFLALAATALAALLIGALLFANKDVGGVPVQPDPAVTATATMTVSMPPSEPSDESTGIGRDESTIELEGLADSARPLEAVRIQGTYRGGPDTFLRVQRWEGGKWLNFPLHTQTDQSGQFTTYVELEQPGRYPLRVVEPDSGVASKTFVLVING
jgi:hypothetical protein